MSKWWLSMSVLRRRLLIFAVLLVFLAISQVACDKSQIRRAEKASDKIVALCDKGERIVAELKDGGLIDPEDADRLSPLIHDVKTSGDELGNVARSLSGDEPDAKARLKAAVLAVSDAADRLNESGILHVKNPETRAKLQKALAVARIAAEIGL